MKNIKNLTSLYTVITFILFQIIGAMVLNKDYSQRLKHLIIYMDIAVILSLLLLFITKVLKKKKKIIDVIFTPCIVFFVFFSIWSYRNASPFNIDPIPIIKISTPDEKNLKLK